MGLQGVECRNLPNPLAWTKLNKINIKSFINLKNKLENSNFDYEDIKNFVEIQDFVFHSVAILKITAMSVAILKS